MKIRTNFVSNSSSSSFVVAIDPKIGSTIKVVIDVDLSDFGKIIKNEKELSEYFSEHYKYYSHEEYTQIYNEYLEYINKGKHIIIGDFSSDSGNATESLLCDQGIPKDTKNIEIIQNEGGY